MCHCLFILCNNIRLLGGEVSSADMVCFTLPFPSPPWLAHRPPPYFPHHTQNSGILSPPRRSPRMSHAGTSPYDPKELSEGKSKSEHGIQKPAGGLKECSSFSHQKHYSPHLSYMRLPKMKISTHILLIHSLFMEGLKLSVNIYIWLYNTNFIHTNSKGQKMKQFQLLIISQGFCIHVQ